ncbi:TetR family transcriptional regulator [Pseudonocardia sediminis]|uniref:TetR family transcriptional regulator n=1 Tax=Pseudonocardia sediminis TaxID=1397368 RepID=A0A4Q7UY85_PSEST|nr:TetR/AcrR family transcriptional regulator C-terminal domain-containing protein [Pseudonocardia sediminis]RZT86765.1 TetR family transcriptional regulator [Pseudonocardia sediminis]
MIVKAYMRMQMQMHRPPGPRSGSVVAAGTVPERPRPGARAVDGDRAAIVTRAIALADDGGLPAVSLRALAAEVGTPTMSLHRRVGGKDELVRLMIGAAFDGAPPPHTAPSGWRSGLETTARRQWEIYRAHPWLAQVVSMTRPQAIPGLLRHAEYAARALEDTALHPHARLELHLILFGYVRGAAVNLAPEAAAQADTGLDADTWAAQADPIGAALATGDFPALARLTDGPEDYPFDLDRLFESGLRRTLDGFGVLVRAARRRAR